MSGTAANVDDLMYNISLNSGSETENPFGTRHIVSAETNTSNTPTLDQRIIEDESENPDEAADKVRLIGQVLELQNTLEDLSQRVDSVKEENLKLQSENQVLGKYIDNLMSTSSVFQQTGTKTKGK